MEKAKESAQEAVALKEKYTSFLDGEKTKISTWVDGERRKLSDEERTILQAAREKSKAELEANRAKVIQESEKARQTLKPLAAEFASEISKKIFAEGKAVPTESFHLRPKQETSKTMSTN